MTEYLNTKQAAAHCGVCVDTIYAWANQGILSSIQLPGRKRRLLRWTREELANALAKYRKESMVKEVYGNENENT